MRYEMKVYVGFGEFLVCRLCVMLMDHVQFKV